MNLTIGTLQKFEDLGYREVFCFTDEKYVLTRVGEHINKRGILCNCEDTPTGEDTDILGKDENDVYSLIIEMEPIDLEREN